MGIYLDPGNGNFSSDSRSEIYIDKTGMFSILNANIGGARRHFAVSRARRPDDVKNEPVLDIDEI